MPPEEIHNIARDLRWLKATNFTFSKIGLLSNNEIGKFVEKYLGEVVIEDSSIPLAIVAADISSGEKVFFKTEVWQRPSCQVLAYREFSCQQRLKGGCWWMEQ